MSTIQVDAWQDFRAWMQHEYRPTTVYGYWLCCRRFLEWGHVRHPDQLSQVHPGEFLDYDTYLKERGVKDRHVHGFALMSLFTYYSLPDLASKIPARREMVSKPPRWLPKPVMELLLDEAPDLRMKALVSLSYDLALRVSEALLLDVKVRPDRPYVDRRTGMANVYRVKTRQYPWLHLKISEQALQAVNDYVANSRAPAPDALFTTRPFFDGGKGGGRMSVYWAEGLWERYMRLVGLNPREWNFKLLRHSRLTWMAVEGKDLIEIAKFAGHSTPNPTLIYLHLSSQYMSHPEVFLEELKGSKIYEPAMRVLRR